MRRTQIGVTILANKSWFTHPQHWKYDCDSLYGRRCYCRIFVIEHFRDQQWMNEETRVEFVNLPGPVKRGVRPDSLASDVPLFEPNEIVTAVATTY